MSKKSNGHKHAKPAVQTQSRKEQLRQTRSKVRRRRLLFLSAGLALLVVFLSADYIYDIPFAWYALIFWIFPLAYFFDSQYLQRIERELGQP